MRNDVPNFNLLAVFAAVMEHGSFSRAADYMDTNQSTISTALNRLKKQIGQELFIRSGRGVVPTSFATHFYEQIQAPLAQLNRVCESLIEFDPRLAKREFVITAPEHLQGILLEQFQSSAYPEITLKVFDQHADDELMYDALQTQQFDLMIDIVPPNNHNVLTHKLYEGQFAIVCSKGSDPIHGSALCERWWEGSDPEPPKITHKKTEPLAPFFICSQLSDRMDHPCHPFRPCHPSCLACCASCHACRLFAFSSSSSASE